MKRIINLKYTVLLASMLLLQSCFVAKDYEKPEIITDNLYRTNAVLDSVSIGQMSWKELFTDAQLQGYIEEGVQNNLDLQIAMQNMLSAEAYMKQGKAGYYPTLNTNGSWTHQEYSKNSQFGRLFSSLDQYELNAKMSWEADIWGKIRSNKRATLAAYLQTEATKRAVQSELVANIASLYYQMLATQEQIKVVQQSLDNRVKSVEVIKALKDAGNVNEVAVKQTEAQLYGTEITLKDLQYNLRVMENSFCILLNRKPSEVEKGSFYNQTLNVDLKTGIPLIMLSNRPDVVASELNFRNTFEQVNVARSSFYPSLTITPTVGLQSLELRDLLSFNSFFATIISGIAQPVFNQRQNKTRLEIAKANQQKAYLQYEKTILTAGKEVSDALASYDNESRKIAIRQKQMDALQNAASYSDELLQYGMVNYLEVLTAKDNAINTEINYINDKYNQLNAVIKLYKALGGGQQ